MRNLQPREQVPRTRETESRCLAWVLTRTGGDRG